MQVRVGVLGSTTVCVDGVDCAVTAPRLRTLLTLLALHRGRPVRRDAIVEALWGGRPPATAHNTLQGYVADLRRVLEPDRRRGLPPRLLRTDGDAYLLDLDPDRLDLSRFELLVLEAGRALGPVPEPTAALAPTGGAEISRAQRLLQEALGLWRGEAVADLGDLALALPERQRLAALRLEAQLAHACAALRLGRPTVAVPALEALAHEHPWDQRVAGYLALALARAGRTVDALDRLRALRSALAEELGLEPGRAIRDLETAIAGQRHDVTPPGSPPPGSPPPGPSRPPVASAPCRADRWPLVGRARETRVLEAALAGVESGVAEVVVVTAEHGGGRSRLCRDVAQRAGLRGLAQVRVAGRSATAASLRDVGARDPADAPLVVVVDDVEEADADALLALAALVDRLLREPAPPAVLLVLAQWSGAVAATGHDPEHALLRVGLRLALGHAVRLDLPPLDDASADELLVAVGGTSVDGAARARMRHRAGGNPFVLVELARDHAARGDGCGPAGSDAGLPESVRAVVRHHLDHLPRRVRRVLSRAAVAGPTVDAARLAAPGGADPDAVQAALDLAVGVGLLADAGSRRYTFRHGVVREVLVAETSARGHVPVASGSTAERRLELVGTGPKTAI